MKRLRTALVGMGDVGRYVAGFLRYDRWFVPQVVVDVNAERAAAGAKRYRFARWTTDFADAIADRRVDAVYLGVPHDLHYPMVMQAIEAGKPVLCEKPITIRVDHATEIVRRSEQLGVPVAVNYQHRYDPSAQRMIALARSGRIGRLQYARCNVPWRREADYFDAAPWHAQAERAGGGTLLTQASHALDLALAAIPATPRYAWGWTARNRFVDVEVEDTALATVQFDDGTVLQVTSSMCAQPERPMQIELYGRCGTLHWQTPGLRRLHVDAPRGSRAAGPRLPWGLHPLQRSMRAFARWVTGGVLSLHPARSAVSVLRVVQACYQSASAGSVRVELEE